MSNLRLQVRRDLAKNWIYNEAHLLGGEMGFEMNTGRLKIGLLEDEEIAWADCEYIDPGFSDVWKPILPRMTETLSIGSLEKQFEHIFVLNVHSALAYYIGDTAIISRNLTDILISTNVAETLRLQTSSGDLTLASAGVGADLNILTSGANSRTKITNSNSDIIIEAILGKITIKSNTFFEQSVSIEKNLTVSGNSLFEGESFVVKADSVLFSKNLLEINAFETGAGITEGTAGLKINRGTLPPYFITYKSSTKTLLIGPETPSNELETVATREWVIENIKFNITAEQILALLITVDGHESDLDADKVDGLHIGTGATTGEAYLPYVTAAGKFNIGVVSGTPTSHRMFVEGGLRLQGELQLEETDQVFLRFKENPVGSTPITVFGIMTKKLGIQFQEHKAEPEGVIGTGISLGIKNTANDSFTSTLFHVGKSGRVIIGKTTDDGNKLQVNGDVSLKKLWFGAATQQMINLWNDNFGIGVQDRTWYARSDNYFAFYKGGVHSSLVCNPGSGGVEVFRITDTGVRITGPIPALVLYDTNVGSRWSLGGNEDEMTFWRCDTKWNPEVEDWVKKLAVDAEGTVEAKRFSSTVNWDGIRGNIYLKGNAPSIVMYDTDNECKWLMHCNTDRLQFLRCITTGNEQVSDWDGKLVLENDGTLRARMYCSTTNWDGIWGNIYLKGSAPSIVMYDTDNECKWLMHCNYDNISFYRCETKTEIATDWRSKVTIQPDGGVRARMFGSASDWDNMWGNIYLTGSAPSIVMYDSDHGKKWAMLCDSDNVTFWRCNTFSDPQATDWVPKVAIQPDGTMMLTSLFGPESGGARSVYANPSGSLIILPSDERFKTNITNSYYGLSEVLQLRSVLYHWNDVEKYGKQRELGLIAQEVQSIIPEVIGSSIEGILSIDYARLVALLIKAIQEQQTRIDLLEKKLST